MKRGWLAEKQPGEGEPAPGGTDRKRGSSPKGRKDCPCGDDGHAGSDIREVE